MNCCTRYIKYKALSYKRSKRNFYYDDNGVIRLLETKNYYEKEVSQPVKLNQRGFHD